jgi:ankyrin repeat protein
MHVAAERGLGAAVQTLCQLGSAVDVQNSLGLSPLHLAARHGHIDVVRCLCLHGANVQLKTNVSRKVFILLIKLNKKSIK